MKRKRSKHSKVLGAYFTYGGQKPLGGLSPNFFGKDIRDIIACFKFGGDRFTGLASVAGQIFLPFAIDFDGRT